MKRIKQLIKIIQFIFAVLLIVSIGWQLISLFNNWFNIEVEPMNIFIYSFLGFIILGVISYFLRKKH